MDAKSLKVVQENRDYTMFSWSVQGASNPIQMKRGQGVWFWDGDDQRWLDFSSQLINLKRRSPASQNAGSDQKTSG